jgi:glycerol-3-phosphate dehydrogenase
MIYFEADDGRICLVFDYLGKPLVGSSDIRADEPDAVRCEDDEVDYFLASIGELLPGLAFDRSQVVYAYSGIRPLPASEGVAPGLISRDHSAPVDEPAGARRWPIMSLVGGKWTTFRGFAEEAADALLTRLGRPRRVSTRELAIGGGRGMPQDEDARRRWIDETARTTGAAADRVRVLLDRYGTRGAAIATHEARLGAGMLTDAPDHSTAEIDWLARNEHVVHLQDVVMRRTDLAITARLSRRDLDAIADIVADARRWSAERRSAEVAATVAELRDRHRLRLDQA